MRGMVKKFFRKANSLLLAAAMVVTLLPAQTASAAGLDALVLQQGNDAAGAVIFQQRAAATDDIPTLEAIQAKEYSVIEGNMPVLPKKVKLADNSVAQIKWSLDTGLKAGQQIVTGTDGTEQIQVTVKVQPCDEAVADVQATGKTDDKGGSQEERLAAIHTLRGYRGLFVTEYDIKVDGSGWTDRAVIYLPETANGEQFQASNAWDFGARLQFKFNHNGKSYFQTQNGDGKVKDNAVYYPMKDDDLRAALDRGENVERLLEFDEKSTYHVRTVMDTLTDKDKANVKIYVTDPEGIEHEVTKEGGNGFRIYPTDGIVKKFAAVRGGFTMTNHKISWISGYATKKTELYLKAEGATDYVKEEQIVSTKELPGVISAEADAEIVRDGKVYKLDTEAQSGWYKDGQKYTGIVSADEGQEVEPVYRAYYKYNKAIDKSGLNELIDEAVDNCKEEDYTASSWTPFEQALWKANQVKADTTADQNTVNKAEQALETAKGNLISIKALKKAIGDLEAELEQKESQKDNYANWTIVERAVADAKKVLNNADATSTQIQRAEEKLAATKLITKAEQELADAKKAMEASVKVAEKKLADEKESEYTPASWGALKEALDACKKLNAETATKEDYNTKREALDLALQGLVKLADKSALNQAIKTAEAKNKADYEEAGWNKMQEKLAVAKTVAGNLNATQSEVDRAKSELQDAIGKLVQKQPPKPTTVKVKSVKRAAKSYQIAAGKKLDLKKVFTVSPSNASNKKLTYSVDKKNFASIKSGVVTVNKKGAGKTVTVKAAATDGSGKSATIKIKIMKNAVKKITVKKKSLTVKAGKKVTIKPTVSPSKNVNKKLSYTSSNTKLATVKNGVVTAKKGKKGKVTITIKSTDGSNKSVKVKITIKK